MNDYKFRAWKKEFEKKEMSKEVIRLGKRSIQAISIYP